METIGKITFVLLSVILIVLYSSFAWGYVASVVYGWFIISQFNGLPVILWWQFAGIMFLVSCFIHSDIAYFKDEVKDSTTGLVTSLLSPWLLLFGAWVFKLFIY